MAKQASGRKQMPKINDVGPKPNNESPVITSLVDASLDKPWILKLSERRYLDQITGVDAYYDIACTIPLLPQ